MKFLAAILFFVCGSVFASTVPTASGWSVPYNGYGFSALTPGGILMAPQASKQTIETHAALALLNGPTPKDFQLIIKYANLQQLRAPVANAWESLWVFFNYTLDANGKKSTNYFALKPTGVELGTAFDSVGQSFLFTSSVGASPMGTVKTLVLIKRGKTISARIDGVSVMNVTNPGVYDVSGQIGLYTEDALVYVQSVDLQSL